MLKVKERDVGNVIFHGQAYSLELKYKGERQAKLYQIAEISYTDDANKDMLTFLIFLPTCRL